MWDLDFIKKDDFYTHIAKTINEYKDNLCSYDLKKFNSNLIDPIKLIFDKSVYRMSWEETIKSEIFRQRDKTNNNSIGYFHQNIFAYIENCEVPQEGWDVIFRKPGGLMVQEGRRVSAVYAELKNKHNTMNSASGQRTYIKMQGQILKDDDCACFLVEAIAKHSQNTSWMVTVDKERQDHGLIRRVSIDKFYEIVTGDPNAFFKICMALPDAIDHVISTSGDIRVPEDTVMEELKKLSAEGNYSIPMALYLLGFNEYIGFT